MHSTASRGQWQPRAEPWWCLSRGDGRHWASLCTVGMLLVDGGFTQQIRQRSGPAWGNVDATPALMEAALVQLAAWGWGVVRLEYRPDLVFVARGHKKHVLGFTLLS